MRKSNQTTYKLKHTWKKKRVVTKKVIQVTNGNNRSKKIIVRSWPTRPERKHIK